MSSDNISIYESYLFTADKSEFLESCKNSSALKQYIRLSHLLNFQSNELPAEDVKLLEQWGVNQNYGDNRNVVMKHKLIKLLNEKDPAVQTELMKTFNNAYLGFGFYDERTVQGSQAQTSNTGGGQAALKSALSEADFKEMATQTKIDLVQNATNNNLPFQIESIDQVILRKIDLTNIKDWSLFERIINYLQNFAFSEVNLL
jgi:hypothetical protein